MKSALPPGYLWDRALRLGGETGELTKKVWPNFLVEPSDRPEPALRFKISAREAARRFPSWGIRRTEDGKLVAYASGAVISADLESDRLPNEGWRFVIESCVTTETPNCFSLVVANVAPAYRSLGLSSALLASAKEIARELGYTTMIGPVRPISKDDFVGDSMVDYVARRTPQGEPYDPWLRAHVRAGAEVLNVCEASVIVTATLPKWREWTGLPLAKSGETPLPGGLAPLDVDLTEGIATYREPNVWVRYHLG